MINLFHRPHRDRVISFLLAGWVLCIVLIIVTHWTVLRYFAVLLLVGALVFFMVSILYALIDSNTRKDKSKSAKHDS